MRPIVPLVVRQLVRTVGALPEPVQRSLAGPPRYVDGQRLATEVQLALRLLHLVQRDDGVPDGDVARQVSVLRARTRAQAALFGASPRVGLVVDIEVPGTAGPIPARLYRGNTREPLEGAVVYLHGGGWVVGDLDTADGICRTLAASSRLAVVSVDYRLAPEHPFPAAVTDAIDAFRWVRDHPRTLRDDATTDGAEPSALPVAVAGDSAGATLATVVARETRDDERAHGGSGGPAFQLLLYPGADLSRHARSYELFGTGYRLGTDMIDWYREVYLAGADATDPRASPLLAEDLSGVAPAHVVVAGFDVLRDEGIAYAERLRAAGVPTTLRVEAELVHAFANATGVGRTGAAALGRAVTALTHGVRAASGTPA